MATKKEPFGGKRAAPFGKGGKKGEEKDEKKPVKATSKSKKK